MKIKKDDIYGYRKDDELHYGNAVYKIRYETKTKLICDTDMLLGKYGDEFYKHMVKDMK